MNGEPPGQPVEHLAQRLLDEAESLVRRDPARALLVALGVGLAIHLVPKRVVASGLMAATLLAVRPALFSLGVMKAFELCCQSSRRIA